MALTVKCTCGKAFEVKDEAAGTSVVCQACGTELHVPGASGPAGAVPESPPAPLPQAAPDAGPSINCPFCAERIPGGLRSCPLCHEAIPAPGSSIACPACAERIPSGLRSCPLCGEAIAVPWSEEEQDRLLAERLRSLEAYAKDLQAQSADKAFKGGFLSNKTIVAGVLFALGLLALCIGAMKGIGSESGGVFLSFGILGSLCSGFAVIVSLVNDYRAFHIQDVIYAALAFDRFFTAVRTGRFAKAYVCLAPEARQAGEVPNVTFESPKVPFATGSYSMRDLPGFKAYWQSIIKGPTAKRRTVRLNRVMTQHQGREGFVLLEAEFQFSYPAFPIEEHEVKRVRKLLLKGGGRWYLAEGDLEGPCDRMAFGPRKRLMHRAKGE